MQALAPSARRSQDNLSARIVPGPVECGMRFALLGNHPDGVEMAAALVATNRYQLAAHTVPVHELLAQTALAGTRHLLDLEEVLADPQIELVIVAGVDANRPAQLRRALQSERHVLAVHPSDYTPEVAYEAAMIQKDTGRALLPLLTEGLHPAVRRLRSCLLAAGPLGSLQLVEMTRPPNDGPGSAAAERKPSFPGWDVLRALGGEIAEVSAFALREEVHAAEPALVSGRFERGGLFQLCLAPAGNDGCRIVAHGSRGRAELFFPAGWRGPAFLACPQGDDQREESWDAWDPWADVVVQLDGALREATQAKTATPQAPPFAADPLGQGERVLFWEDEIRCLELDEAARRSVEKRRSSVLEYQEASEAVGFKGTMTLVGCALLWGLLAVLLLLAVVGGLQSTKSGHENALPENFGATLCIGAIFGVPLFVFLLLQVLRLLARDNRGKQNPEVEVKQGERAVGGRDLVLPPVSGGEARVEER
jgi:predicted dehydrogenase